MGGWEEGRGKGGGCGPGEDAQTRAAPRLRGLRAGDGRRVLAAAEAEAARSRPRARGAPAAARAARLRARCAAMARPPGRSRGVWVPLFWLLLAGPAACAASPGDDGAGPGGRGPRGRVRGDAGADEAVRRHDSSYGTFAGEFYDLRYLSEEGEAGRVRGGGGETRVGGGDGDRAGARVGSWEGREWRQL